MKLTSRLLPLMIALLFVFVLKSCIIHNPQPENCEIIEATITRISESGTLDIVFHDEEGEFYYINRGLERGLTLEGMSTQVLHKKATLHLAKTVMGTSNHIAQLAVGEEILFTEFKSEPISGITN